MTSFQHNGDQEQHAKLQILPGQYIIAATYLIRHADSTSALSVTAFNYLI